MKCLRRCLSALLCCALLLGVSSVGVNAANNTTYKVYEYHQYPNTFAGTGLTFTPNNGIVEKNEYTFIYHDYPTYPYYSVYRVSNSNTGVLINSGSNAKVRFNNVYFSLLLTDIGAPDGGNLEALNYLSITKPDSVFASVTYMDGSSQTYRDEVVTIKKDKLLHITFDFTPDKDVSSIAFFAKVDNVFYGYQSAPYTEYTEITMYSGEIDGDDKFQFSIEVYDGVKGFLSNIVDWIKGIFDKLGEIFSKLGDLPSLIWGFFENMINHIHQSIQVVILGIGDLPEFIWGKFRDLLDTVLTTIKNFRTDVIEWFGGVVNWLDNIFISIIELPSYVWEFFENGLKKLFIPTDQDIVDFKEEFSELLEDRFGAIYQAGEILGDSWKRIETNDIQNTVELPKVTINLPENNKFSFGGYEVLVVPDRFEFLADIIKGFVGVIATVLFINGLRKKYDEVMR